MENQAYWDTVARENWERKAELRRKIKKGFPYLEQYEPKMAPYLQGMEGKQVLVLQFGDGLVMLSLAVRGARVTGVDLSKEQVRLAKISARECGVDIDLLQADCQDLSAVIPDSRFDVAVAEDGVFSWIEALSAWMQSSYAVLREGGLLVVSDHHPIASCLTTLEEGGPRFATSYLYQGPRPIDSEDGAPRRTVFLWKLSDVVNAAVEAGFLIEHMDEFSEPAQETLVPKYFLLVAKKPRRPP